MTVHGSKGLQSPIVILADSCVDPNRSPGKSADLGLGDGTPPIPVFRPRKSELAEPLQSQIEAQDALDRPEHWRLLYVDLTRADESLSIGGAPGTARPPGTPVARWMAVLQLDSPWWVER